jgi:hypothetical protein
MRLERYILTEGIIDDVIDDTKKCMYHWKNTCIIKSVHGLDRIAERNKLTMEQLKVLFKKAIEKAIELGVHTGEEILFWSKSLQQAFVSAITPDGDIKLITFLPRGKHTAKPGTEHVVVEGKQIRIVELD